MKCVAIISFRIALLHNRTKKAAAFLQALDTTSGVQPTRRRLSLLAVRLLDELRVAQTPRATDAAAERLAQLLDPSTGEPTLRRRVEGARALAAAAVEQELARRLQGSASPLTIQCCVFVIESLLVALAHVGADACRAFAHALASAGVPSALAALLPHYGVASALAPDTQRRAALQRPRLLSPRSARASTR